MIQIRKYRRAGSTESSNVVRDPTSIALDTVSNGPSGEAPALMSAVNPGMSLWIVRELGLTGVPASRTRPTPLFRLPNAALW